MKWRSNLPTIWMTVRYEATTPSKQNRAPWTFRSLKWAPAGQIKVIGQGGTTSTTSSLVFRSNKNKPKTLSATLYLTYQTSWESSNSTTKQSYRCRSRIPGRNNHRIVLKISENLLIHLKIYSNKGVLDWPNFNQEKSSYKSWIWHKHIKKLRTQTNKEINMLNHKRLI